MKICRDVRSTVLPPLGALVLLVTLLCPRSASAQPPPSNSVCNRATSALEVVAQPCLTELVTTDTHYAFNGLEVAAARADDAAYASLLPVCVSSTGAIICGGTRLNLFNRLLQLENNADELLGFGQTKYSLDLTAQDLGFALRWTADEEFAAQSSLMSRLANNQVAAVSSRLSVLRFMQAVRLARLDASAADGLFADDRDQDTNVLGGGGSADPGSAQFGNWSVFANGSYGAGTRAPTTFDDAFNFGGTQITAGADVRLSRRMVVGFLLSHTNQEADFNSSESIAAGGIKSNGGGITGYMQLEWDAAYLNFSLGGQRFTLDSRRVVAYVSNNPEIPSVNTTFSSSTNATSVMATGGGGYVFHARGFSAEPYLNANFVYTKIGAFSESATGPDLGLGASVSSQGITSLVGVAGLKFEYTFLPSFGVIVPYVYGEVRREFRDPAQNVASQFSPTTSGQEYFQLPTDNIRADYYEAGAGLSTVLPHGAQFYLQYVKVLSLQYYTDYVASGGFRSEF
jgi:outer membrane lipase/esterase